MGCTLVLPTVSIDAMNKYPAELSICLGEGAIAVLVIAGWHRSAKLMVPDVIVLLQLPPYPPELNPVENLQEYPRVNSFAHQAWEAYEAVMDGTP